MHKRGGFLSSATCPDRCVVLRGPHRPFFKLLGGLETIQIHERMPPSCGSHTISNFTNLNSLFLKLNLIGYPYKILVKSGIFEASN